MRSAVYKYLDSDTIVVETYSKHWVSKSVGLVKKQERTGDLSNSKQHCRPWKTTIVDDRRMLTIVKKNPWIHCRIRIAQHVWRVGNSENITGAYSGKENNLLSLNQQLYDMKQHTVGQKIENMDYRSWLVWVVQSEWLSSSMIWNII